VQGKKKKRGYAAQAYEFGAGGNAGLTPAAPLAAPQVPAYGGYPGAEGATYPGAPGAAVPAGYGQGATLGGYQPPTDPAYGILPVQPGAEQVTGNDVGSITGAMAQLGVVGGGPGLAPQPQGPTGKTPLNQLYPTDLLNQPFQVSELELGPPPIILPPNVSSLGSKSGYLC
jgi:protein transport protein SEC24